MTSYANYLKLMDGWYLQAYEGKFACPTCDFKCSIESDMLKHREAHENVEDIVVYPDINHTSNNWTLATKSFSSWDKTATLKPSNFATENGLMNRTEQLEINGPNETQPADTNNEQMDICSSRSTLTKLSKAHNSLQDFNVHPDINDDSNDGSWTANDKPNLNIDGDNTEDGISFISKKKHNKVSIFHSTKYNTNKYVNNYISGNVEEIGDKEIKVECNADYYLLGGYKEINSSHNEIHPVSVYKSVISKELTWTCPFCGYISDTYKNLQKHLAIHENYKPNSCIICRKTFGNTFNLDRHMRIHTGERPFKCRECESSFMDKSALDKHYYTHTKEKPFECSDCNFRTSLKGSLTKHKKEVHLGIKRSKAYESANDIVDLDINDTHNNWSLANKCERSWDLDEDNPDSKSGYVSEQLEKDEDITSISVKDNINRNVHNFALESVNNLEDIEIDVKRSGNHSLLNEYEQKIKRAYNVSNNIVTKNITWHCPFCQYISNTHKSLYKHVSVHENYKRHSCIICEKTFGNSGNLDRHMRVHTGERPFKCTECDSSFADKAALSKHHFTHTKEKPFACDECDYRASLKGQLTKHKKVYHLGIKRFTCFECEYKTDCASHLKDHISLVHSKEKPFTCSECDYRCALKGDMKRHIELHELKRTGTKNCLCHICGFRAATQKHIKKHLKSHSRERKYLCTECGTLFTTNASLTRHLMIHKGEKPFSCSMCDYKCIQKSTLRTHLISHMENKLLKCTDCDFTCTDSITFNKHQSIHDISHYEFSCSECEYSCNSKNSFENHKLLHSGEKPFKCNICDYACRTKGNMNLHKMIHTGEKPHKCPYCDYACRQKGSLKRHIVFVHPMERREAGQENVEMGSTDF